MAKLFRRWFFYRSKKDTIITLRMGSVCFQAKGKHSHPLFSERYGYKKPFLRLGSWRFFLFRSKDMYS
jgi:hypothetical protein